MLTDKRIGVLMGGISAEREVSLKSGQAIYGALENLGYNVIAIDTGKDICTVLAAGGVQIAFLALHGGWGEDGSVQGMLEVLGIPYTGSGVLASAIAMDKEASKKVFRYHGIPVPPYVVLDREAQNGLPSVDFPLPWVVKPASEGSSIGVSIVRQEHDFRKAIAHAHSYGPRVIIEQYIDGKEIHMGVLNGEVIGGVEVRPSLEFYSYEAKYTSGLTEYILPPEVDGVVYERAGRTALSAHHALGCKGATRIDLRIDGKGNPYVLEINTIPGMTETSLLPKIARLAGYDFPGLIEEILRGTIHESE
jgi:D-alanine-D-alanine ligase